MGKGGIRFAIRLLSLEEFEERFDDGIIEGTAFS